MWNSLHRLATPGTISFACISSLAHLNEHGSSRRKREVVCEEAPLRIAFLGNSYFYYNDVPRLIQALWTGTRELQIQDCLHGGTSWTTLLKKGNGMQIKFKTQNALRPDGSYDMGARTVEALLADPAGWHFVIMNTYSQEAAIPSRRQDGLAALDKIAPMLDNARACPVLMPTPAYRDHAKGSERIGTWEEFSWKQSEGFVMYANHLAERRGAGGAGSRLRMADANRAFELVHGERPELWRELFYKDGMHPSALGSFLEACVIYCTVFDEQPQLPTSILESPSLLFARARRMLPPPDVGRMPTAEELLYLRGVAVRVWSSDVLSGVQK